MKTAFASMLMASTIIAGVAPAMAEDVSLTIESWRNDDLQVWQEKIIPAFEKAHPDIKVTFQPAAPTEYNAALNAKLAAGSAGDLITCRPFDASLELYKKGYLAPVDDVKGMENFSDVAKAAWQTDDAKTTFCVPMASVIHGFIYNADAFKELGVEPPKTEQEFFDLLQKIKDDGTYIPLAMGTKDQWEAATMGYQNIGPDYWDGEKGRKALIAGEEKLTDPDWVKPFETLAKWAPYMGDGYQAQAYPDSQNLFTLGRAAIYPAGSWDISVFNAQADFKMGAFPPPVPEGGKCFISDQPDHALAMNAKTAHPEAARTFLEWVASKDFAELYGNALPGFFPLTNEKVELSDPLAKTFLSWRDSCEPTMRSTYQILSRGTPNLENETWTAAANVINGTVTPEEAAASLQKGLDSWYKPGK
ncbi:ABC transporter substrate-binding protein [Mangrovibrevibacter kandeliae]|uniref:ABC transporter substrate-binding protein n=1 Tax=Mangrovibrevibacter kandeliae TaxID=2968473 RepID=UPI0021189D43|nr:MULTISPECIES: ABC transporter substrate-binding protein [unclassified Aurantimonas]MCQ8781457.1 ABC transporter substrate-binding protein [Aurantimonas sp. CSK15Z-1]MCW4114237.1 ABC transporter substrate-binding protein [Aurantimonas sp. MSK8Z-1]